MNDSKTCDMIVKPQHDILTLKQSVDNYNHRSLPEKDRTKSLDHFWITNNIATFKKKPSQPD